MIKPGTLKSELAECVQRLEASGAHEALLHRARAQQNLRKRLGGNYTDRHAESAAFLIEEVHIALENWA